MRDPASQSVIDSLGSLLTKVRPLCTDWVLTVLPSVTCIQHALAYTCPLTVKCIASLLSHATLGCSSLTRKTRQQLCQGCMAA